MLRRPPRQGSSPSARPLRVSSRLADRNSAIHREMIRTTIGYPSAAAWETFIEPLIPEMTVSELRDYVWVDHAQQRADVLAAVRRRLGVPEDPRRRRCARPSAGNDHARSEGSVGARRSHSGPRTRADSEPVSDAVSRADLGGGTTVVRFNHASTGCVHCVFYVAAAGIWGVAPTTALGIRRPNGRLPRCCPR